MSRRTFIKQWNPAVPIGGRGRGRARGKKGGDPDQVYLGAIRTVHDPSVDARRQGGRDTEGSTRFYSASGLNAAGLPAPDDRFRAQTLPSARGGRGKIQQRVGMFRNAIQSNVIFGGTADKERVLRTSRKKIERILAPESDVSEPVTEWRRSPPKNSNRRRDVYEYETEEEEVEEEEAPRYHLRRRVSNTRRAPPYVQRRDPDYDPYEFRDDESADEGFPRGQPAPRPRRTNSRTTAGAPTMHFRPALAPWERKHTKDERKQSRRLFGETDDEGEEMEEYDRRTDKRRTGGDRQEPPRMEKRNSKRAREMSPPRPLVPLARHPLSKRNSHIAPHPIAAVLPPAPRPQSSVHWLREQAAGIDDAPETKPQPQPQKPKGYDANYTPGVAMGIARRILSGLPKIRLKDDDGAESYVTASRSIIAGALQRFTADEPEEGGSGDPPAAAAGAGGSGEGQANPGANVLRELMNRTQLINVSEESEDDEDEQGSAADAKGRFENIFSRHAREDSPVLERLFNQTMREASNPFAGEINEEEEVDTAKMLGLEDATEPQPGSVDVDPFAIVPHISGDDSGEASSRGSHTSALSSAHFARRTMADSHRSLALLATGQYPPLQLPPQQHHAQQQRYAVGGEDNRSSDDYSSDRSRRSAASRMGRGGGGNNEKTYAFQMGGLPPSHSTHKPMQPPSHQQHQRYAVAGGGDNRSSDDYSSERSRGSAASRISGRSSIEKSFPFQMGGLPPSHSMQAPPPSNFEFRSHNNNDGSFNFQF